MRWIGNLPLWIALSACSVWSQKGAGGPFFFLDAANFASRDTGMGRIEIFVKVAHSELVFTRFQSQFYRAQYEITFQIFDKSKNLVKRDIQDREIQLAEYQQTTSDVNFHFSRLTLDLLPGDYLLQVNIMDKETQKAGQRQLEIPARTFRDRPIGISDLIFADRIQKDTTLDIVNIVPNVFKSFDNEYKKYAVYFEIYDERFALKHRNGEEAVPDTDDVKIHYRVLDKNQKLVLEDSTVRRVWQFQTFSSVEIDKPKLSFGKYILDITARLNQHRASTKAIFDVRLSAFMTPSLAAQSFDLDQAIKQMRHIARGDNISKILKKTLTEKEEYFTSFWKKRDPTPDTERNELMEEYYRRVDYANRYFTSGFREGWDNDRGMVYIILGAPDDIERHPYESNEKPYEIWYFYQSALKLIFVDFNSVGDYELYNRMEFESYLSLR